MGKVSVASVESACNFKYKLGFCLCFVTNISH